MRRYQPPAPTFSSSEGASAATTASNVIPITATFNQAVTGVTAADFGFTSSNTDVSITTAVSGSGKVWVLTATVTDSFADTDITVTMPQESGAISPLNAAGTNNGFNLKCTYRCTPYARLRC